MKKLVYFVLLIVVFAACSPKIIYLPGKTEYVVRDSLITKIDTIKVDVPVESHSNFAKDSSHLETTLAISDAVVDSLGLHHTLRNKKTTIPVAVPSTEHIVYRDSIVVKEVPVEVQVEKIVKRTPWYAKVLSAFGVLFIILAAIWVGLKFGKLR